MIRISGQTLFISSFFKNRKTLSCFDDGGYFNFYVSYRSNQANYRNSYDKYCFAYDDLSMDHDNYCFDDANYRISYAEYPNACEGHCNEDSRIDKEYGFQ